MKDQFDRLCWFLAIAAILGVIAPDFVKAQSDAAKQYGEPVASHPTTNPSPNPTATTRPTTTRTDSLISRVVFPKDARDVTLTLQSGWGLILIADVKINGEAVGLFAVDTSADWTVISTELADKLRLQRFPGTEKTVRAVASISVGGVEIRNHFIAARTLPRIAGIGEPPVVGLLGADILSKIPFTLDLENRTFTLHDPAQFRPPTSDRVRAIRLTLTGAPGDGSWASRINPNAGVPCIRGKVNDWPATMMIDTGATPTAIINEAFALAHPEVFDPEMIYDSDLISLSDHGPPRRAKIDRLEAIDPLTNPRRVMARPRNVHPEKAGVSQPDHDVTLGVRWMERYRLTFDYAARALYAETIEWQSADKRLEAGKITPNGRDVSGLTDLMQCVIRDDLAGVSALLKAGAASDVVHRRYGTALHLSAKFASPGVTKRLLDLPEAKTTINQPNAAGSTALHMAVSFAPPETVRALLDAGADLNLTAGDERQKPLLLAARRGSPAIVKMLIDAKADVNEASSTRMTPIVGAAESGSVETFELLLGAGAKLEVQRLVGNALHAAAAAGDETMLRRVLQHVPKSFGIDDENETGATALIRAAQHGNARSIKLLLDHGAKAHVTAGPMHLTALHCAVGSGDVESVKVLLAHGCQPEARTNEGFTPLMAAAFVDRAEIIQTLVAAGAKHDLKDTRGFTALHYAVREGSPQAVKALLEAGADPRIKNIAGEDAFTIAKKKDRSDLQQLLESSGR